MEQSTSYPVPTRKGFITNYPPFRHWKKTDFKDIVSGKPINIYIHIPFCLQRCAYCYYRTTDMKGVEKSRLLNEYVNALCMEIEIASKHFHLKEREVVSIYIGGGTPTLLKSEQLNRVVDTLHKHLNIETPEFTVEAEPVTLTQKKAELLEKIGVNRISLGVQSFTNEILNLCHRLDNEDKVVKAIELAKGTGSVVNIDLLSGLAGETMESWKYTMERALATNAESITVYKMELYANTDYYRSLRKDKIKLPSDKDELEFMTYAMEQFKEANYHPWCFFTYTKEGQYKNRYASSIWSGVDCYAFGASGFGSLGNWLYQNTNEVDKYMSLITAGELPVNRGYSLTSLDQMIRTIALGMKLIRLDLREFQNQYGFKLESLSAQTLEQLQEEALITVSEDSITLTSKGILYGDYVGKRISASLQAM